MKLLGFKVPSLWQALLGPSKADIKKMPPQRWYRVKRFGGLKRWVRAEDRRVDDIVVERLEVRPLR